MFIQVASYRLGTGSVQDVARRIEEGNLPVVREAPGFIDYFAIDAGDGVVASVMILENGSSAREAESRLEGWIERTTEEFQVTPLELIEGEVIATTRP